MPGSDQFAARVRSLAEWVVAAAFLAVIATPLPVQWMGAAASVSRGQEKKKPSARPQCPRTAAEFWRFPERFAAYYGDRFGLRPLLIRWHARAMYDGLGVSPTDTVLLGRDGWMFYADDGSILDYRSRRPFSRAEMETWRVALEEMQAWLARRGCRFLVVLACDKYLIYPEVLPRGLARTAGPFRIEQFATHLRRYSTVPVVGLLDPLLAARKKERIYHRTDSHWNDRGAYVGYAEIMNRLAKWDPRLRPNPTSAFERVEADTTGWDIPKLMKLADRIHEEDRRLVPRDGWQAKATVTDPPDDRWNCARIVMERGDKALPRLLVFRDSFGSALVPFLSEHFRYAEFMWQYEFDPRIVERARPDAVIFEIASRRLQWYVPENPPLP